jgi:ankyrin repeat protein
MKTHFYFIGLCGQTILLRAAVVLLALGWSNFALCDEIHDAAMAGDVGKVEALLKHDPDLVFSTNYGANNKGWTPLHVAALFDRTNVAKVLLANKADVDAKDSDAHTPLHMAAGKGKEDFVALLIANKADINAKDIMKGTPLIVAADNNRKEVVELLLANKVEVNARNIEGWTALRFAEERGHKEVADALRAHGANE